MLLQTPVTLRIVIKRMSVIIQQGLKQVLLKHCDFIVSSLEAVGSGVKFTNLLGTTLTTGRNCWILPQIIVKMNIPL